MGPADCEIAIMHTCWLTAVGCNVVWSLNPVVAVYDPWLSLSDQTQECYINISVADPGGVPPPFHMKALLIM